MSEAASGGRRLGGGDVPRLPRHVKLRHDAARGAWVMLAPERVLAPDETALEIVRACDGARTVDAIVARLAESYDEKPETIRADVLALLQSLLDRGFLELAGAPAERS